MLVFRFKVVQRDAGKIRNDDVTGNFLVPPFARQVLYVTERLRFGLAQILAGGLVFHQNDAGPKEINVTVIAGNFLHRSSKLATARRETPKT